MTTDDQRDWVVRKSTGIRANTYASSREARLVFFVGGEAVPKPLGHHRVGVFQNIDEIGMVNMMPKTLEVSWSKHLKSRDGIALSLGLSVAMKVANNDDAIRRVALNAVIEERLTTDLIIRAWQHVCGASTYSDLRLKGPQIIEPVKREIANLSNPQTDEGVRCAFDVLEMVIQEFRATDPAIEAAESERAKAAELAMTSKEQLRHKYAVEDIESERDIARREGELTGRARLNQFEQNEREKQAAFERKQRAEEFSLELEHERRRSELAARDAELRAKLLADPAGLWALHPEWAAKIELQRVANDKDKLRALQDMLEDMLPRIIDTAERDGAQRVLAEIVKKKIGLDLNQTEANVRVQLGDSLSNALGASDKAISSAESANAVDPSAGEPPQEQPGESMP